MRDIYLLFIAEPPSCCKTVNITSNGNAIKGNQMVKDKFGLYDKIESKNNGRDVYKHRSMVGFTSPSYLFFEKRWMVSKENNILRSY